MHLAAVSVHDPCYNLSCALETYFGGSYSFRAQLIAEKSETGKGEKAFLLIKKNLPHEKKELISSPLPPIESWLFDQAPLLKIPDSSFSIKLSFFPPFFSLEPNLFSLG